MSEERASKKQQELLSFVDGFIKGNGYGPSYREIMRALGYRSVSTVAIHIDGLIAKGYLARRDKSARSLEVVSMQPAPQTTAAPDNNTTDLVRELKTLVAAAELSPDETQTAGAVFERIGLKDVIILPKGAHGSS